MRCLLRVFSRSGCSLCQRGNLLSHIPFRRLEGCDVLGHLLLLARDLLRGTAHDGEIAGDRLQLLLYCTRNVGQFRRRFRLSDSVFLICLYRSRRQTSVT
jgi:hypothetical protein